MALLLKNLFNGPPSDMLYPQTTPTNFSSSETPKTKGCKKVSEA